MKRLYCYVLKCISKVNSNTHYKFSIGSTYYARSGLDKLDSVGVFDDTSMYRYTGLDRCYFINADGTNLSSVTFLGYNWEVIKIVQVDDDFDFCSGMKNLVSVLTPEDKKMYDDKIFEYERKGGSLEFLTELMIKYDEVRRMI